MKAFSLKRVCAKFYCVVFFLLLVAFAVEAKDPESVAGEYLVKLKSRPTLQSLSTLSDTLLQGKLQLKERVSAQGVVYLATEPKRENLSQGVLQSLISQKEIDYIEPNYIYRISTGGNPPPPSGGPDESEPRSPDPAEATNPKALIPNDPLFSQLYGLRNNGQRDTAGQAGKAFADMKAAQAWNLSQGSRKIIVAIVDTGIDYNHEDIKANLWSKTVSGNVIHGYNAIKKSYDPMDDNSHGTHVAGTIGAVGNNGIGVSGVNMKVSLMAIKFLGSDGGGSSADAIRGVDFAIANGADVINNSWGGGGRSQALFDALKRAEDAGIVVVNAAGNEDSDNDRVASYPANYDVASMISVAASDNSDIRASFSNYGKQSVELFAPGKNILSTVPGNGYKCYSGTSMATPHVSGAAALLLSYDTLTPQKNRDRALAIRKRLMDTASFKGRFRDTAITSGRLNVLKALNP